MTTTFDKHNGRQRRSAVKSVITALGLLLVTILGGLHFYLTARVRAGLQNANLAFEDEVADPRSVEESVRQRSLDRSAFRQLPEPVPFTEIEALDDEAKDWSDIFGQYTVGAAVFDANNDGRLDIYLTQNGDNWTRPTDDRGVLLPAPRHQCNVLYLNQGNDGAGRPIFKRAAELAAANPTYVREELLIENFLFPRHAVDDSAARTARQSNLAVAADFNGDGRLDLLVANTPPGMLWSHAKTRRVLSQFVSPSGRQARYTTLPLTPLGQSLIDYQPRDNTFDSRPSSRGDEPFGANSLFLNLGDKDNDGLPEWEDVSREAGIEGARNTHSLAVADLDLDGDLDVYEANLPDMDFWPGGSAQWAGGVNCLYFNQLAETGELRFVERAAALNVDGIFDQDYPMPSYYKLRRIPFLPREYSLIFGKFVAYQPEPLVINGQPGERAEVSWSSMFQDANDDGYPDLWVANDFGHLRLLINERGERFTLTDHARSQSLGNWMSFAAEDFDGDLKEDVLAGNIGGSIMSISVAVPNPYALFDPVMTRAVAYQQYFSDTTRAMHALVDGSDLSREIPNKVLHSRVLPPDSSLPNNVRKLGSRKRQGDIVQIFDLDSLDVYEFAWGISALDVQNDGLMDFYFLGCLFGRGGGLFPIVGTGPGRLLVNATSRPGAARFIDLTAEHHVFNILELNYDRLADGGYVYRKAPRQNWAKRDVVFSHDRSTWTRHGAQIVEKVTNSDLTQTAENGRTVLGADLNNDGFADLLLRNKGGYDSRSSTASNLQVRINGKVRALPAHNYNYPTLTNFEAGSTRIFINNNTDHNWIKVRLVDDSPGLYNHFAIGAKVVLNDRFRRTVQASQGGYAGNKFEDLLFGLGGDSATSVAVHWPDRERTVSRYRLAELERGTLTISKTRGLVAFEALPRN